MHILNCLNAFAINVLILMFCFIRKWLKTDFMSLVHKHRAKISAKTNKATAISSTNGIMTILRAWNNEASPEKVFSMGVLSTGKTIHIILKHEIKIQLQYREKKDAALNF